MSETVLLVNPGKRYNLEAIHPPLNIGYLAAHLLKHGIPVAIADEVAGDDVGRILRRVKPRFVGITAMTPTAVDAYKVARYAKGLGLTTIMGGVHASVMSGEALEHVDIVVRGEGEQAMLDVVLGKNKSRIIDGENTGNLDDIPQPAWHLFRMDYYASTRDRLPRTHLQFVPLNTRTAAIITTRGCPYKCVFCYNSWRKYPVRFNSPGRVIEEIKTLVGSYGIKALFFFDDDLFANRPRLEEICRMLIKEDLGLIWGCQANANSLTMQAMKIAREAGCRQIGFGFESGSERILQMLKGKSASIEKNREALRMCRQEGILSWATFMVGNPTETMEDLRKTAEFIRENHIDGIGAHITTPYPGTELWEWCKNRNLLEGVSRDWSRLTTGGAILACDTLPPKVIREYRDFIFYYKNPPTFRQLLRRLLSKPVLLLSSLKEPKKMWRVLRTISTAHSAAAHR